MWHDTGLTQDVNSPEFAHTDSEFLSGVSSPIPGVVGAGKFPVPTFEQVYRENQKRIYLFFRHKLLRVVGANSGYVGQLADLAEDMTQSLFVAIAPNYPSFAGACPVVAWLYQVANRRWLNYQRDMQAFGGARMRVVPSSQLRLGTDGTDSENEATAWYDTGVLSAAADPTGPFDHLVAVEMQARLYQGLDQLMESHPALHAKCCAYLYDPNAKTPSRHALAEIHAALATILRVPLAQVSDCEAPAGYDSY